MCHLDAGMTRQGLDELIDSKIDFDMDECIKNIKYRNPKAEVIPIKLKLAKVTKDDPESALFFQLILCDFPYANIDCISNLAFII